MEPVRTCVGCSKRAPRSDLTRVVLAENASEVVVDLRGRLPGRGAWIHLEPACIDLAQKRRALQRALRHRASLSVTPIRDALAGRG